jgi:DNA replicative helicase MCM subunit Mcm2 (Cdc46/Mcm family)
LGNKNTEEEVNLPPPLFTRYDRPYPYKFKENPDSSIVEHINEKDGTVTQRKTVKRVGQSYNFISGKKILKKFTNSFMGKQRSSY